MNQLLAKRQAVVDAEAALGAVKGELRARVDGGAKLSDGQRAAVTKAEAEVSTAKRDLAAYEQQLADEVRPDAPLIDGTHGSQASAPGVTRGRKWAEVFGLPAAANDDWHSAGEFLATIGAGLSDPRLQSAALNSSRGFRATAGEFSDPLGGFAVPVQVPGRSGSTVRSNRKSSGRGRPSFR